MDQHQINLLETFCTGIDVTTDKRDRFILDSEDKFLPDVFNIPNNAESFDILLQIIYRCTHPEYKIKAGLEAAERYNYSILGFLLDQYLPTCVISLLHTSLYRKNLNFHKTKTDRIDVRTIAAMLISDVNLKVYTQTSYRTLELKSLTRNSMLEGSIPHYDAPGHWYPNWRYDSG